MLLNPHNDTIINVLSKSRDLKNFFYTLLHVFLGVEFLSLKMVISRHFFTGSRFFVLFPLFSFNLYFVLNKVQNVKNFHSYLLYTAKEFCNCLLLTLFIYLFQLSQFISIKCFYSISAFFHEHSRFTEQ